MTRTSSDNFKHTCTFCDFQYSKCASDMVRKNQEFNVIECPRCKNMETIRRSEGYSVIYQHKN